MIYEDLIIGFLAGALATIVVRNFTDGYLKRQAFKKQEGYIELVSDDEVSETNNSVEQEKIEDSISPEEQKELEITNPKI